LSSLLTTRSQSALILWARRTCVSCRISYHSHPDNNALLEKTTRAHATTGLRDADSDADVEFNQPTIAYIQPTGWQTIVFLTSDH